MYRRQLARLAGKTWDMHVNPLDSSMLMADAVQAQTGVVPQQFSSVQTFVTRFSRVAENILTLIKPGSLARPATSGWREPARRALAHPHSLAATF